ncbi:hypothetical protein E4M16_14150, partial [Ligilactobacillus ruminis]
ATLGKHMSTFTFGLLTFAIILAFILLENFFKDSLEILSLIGGVDQDCKLRQHEECLNDSKHVHQNAAHPELFAQ